MTNQNTTQTRDQQQQDMQRQVKDKAQSAVQEARTRASEMTDQARHEANRRVDQRTDQVAGRLNKVADSLRHVSSDLHEQDEDLFANYTDMAADQVEQFAHYVGEHDGGDLMNEVRRFAERQPELFVGGALAAGFLLGRFFKSTESSSSRRSGRDADYYDTDYYQTDFDERTGRAYGYGDYGRSYREDYRTNYGYDYNYGRPGAQGVRASQYGEVYDTTHYGSGGTESEHLGARETEVNRGGVSHTSLQDTSGTQDRGVGQTGQQTRSGEVPAQPGQDRGVPQLGETKTDDWSTREQKDKPNRGQSSQQTSDKDKQSGKGKEGS